MEVPSDQMKAHRPDLLSFDSVGDRGGRGRGGGTSRRGRLGSDSGEIRVGVQVPLPAPPSFEGLVVV